MATKQQTAQSDFPDVPRGMDLLNRQLLNKGTAFTEEERRHFGLDGLLPPHCESLEEQVVRAYEAYKRKDDDLERHIYLRALQDTNEVLFYRLLRSPWPVSNSVTSTGGPGDYSSLTRCATPFRRSCGTVPIRMST